MKPVGVFLGGEGRNELGSRARDPAYQSDEELGVVQALLINVQSDGWAVVGATTWSKIRKYRAKGPTPSEEQNVLGLVEAAARVNAPVVAFVRDADDDADRPRSIDDALQKAQDIFPRVKVIGGTAIPVLEGWILAMTGESGTERLRKTAAQAKLASKGFPPKCTSPAVAIAMDLTMSALPRDAKSLRRWFERARDTLPPLVQAASEQESERVL